MTYEKIRASVKAEAESRKTNVQKYITPGNLRNYLTTTRWNQYEAGKITEDQAIKYATARQERQIDKAAEEKLAKLDTYASAADVTEIKITTEWKKNRTWGNNPTCTTTIYTERGAETYTDSASGCGYDKESAAAAGTLNASPEVRKMLCDYREKVEEGKEPEHFTGVIGVVPVIDGGIGMTAIQHILEDCGMELSFNEHGKTWDVYYFTRKA